MWSMVLGCWSVGRLITVRGVQASNHSHRIRAGIQSRSPQHPKTDCNMNQMTGRVHTKHEGQR